MPLLIPPDARVHRSFVTAMALGRRITDSRRLTSGCKATATMMASTRTSATPVAEREPGQDVGRPLFLDDRL